MRSPQSLALEPDHHIFFDVSRAVRASENDTLFINLNKTYQTSSHPHMIRIPLEILQKEATV